MGSNDQINKQELECTELLHHIFADIHSLYPLLITKDTDMNDYVAVNTNLQYGKIDENKPGNESSIDIEFERENHRSVAPPHVSCYQLLDIIGNALYNIFSKNNEVLAADGSVYDIGSWRGSAGFIADYLNEYYPCPDMKFDYTHFYWGTPQDENNKSVMYLAYKYIFTKLKEKDCNWRYFNLRAEGLEDPVSEDSDTGEGLLNTNDLPDMQNVDLTNFARPLTATVKAFIEIYRRAPEHCFSIKK